MAAVQVGRTVHHCGRWATPREAALARDRLVLHLGVDYPLNLPIEARVLGAASAAELAREAVERHRRRVGRSAYIGLRRGQRKAWLAFVIQSGVHHHIGALEDAEALAILRDRVARQLRLPKYSWNFPDRKLSPLSLEAARVEVRRLRDPASSFKGVSPNGDRWIATITLDYEQLTLGTWATELDAARAYDRAVRHYRGDAAPRNFPRERLEPASAQALRREARLQPRDWRSSRYSGVVKNPNPEAGRPWQAFVAVRGTNHFAGAWPSEREAAIAVDRGLRYYKRAGKHDLNLPAEALQHAPASIGELREIAHAEYKQTTTSQYRGVHFRAGRYDAYLVHRGKRIWIGRFDTEEEAAIERDKLARKLHGKRAKLNFPDDA
jgi:hypothetical protein